MEVEHSTEVVDGHSVEIGKATWSPKDRSVRDRYQTASGGFSPRSSSEVPMRDLERIIEFVAQHDELSVTECAKIINALSASILRQRGDGPQGAR